MLGGRSNNPSSTRTRRKTSWGGMAGEMVGGMAASPDSGVLFFIVGTKASWSFGAGLGSGSFFEEAESLFSYLSSTLFTAAVLCIPEGL